MKYFRLLALAPLAMLSLSANAAGEYYAYGGLGNVGFDIPGADDNEIYDDPSVTIGGGRYFSEHFALEGFYRYSGISDSVTINNENLDFDFDSHQFGLSLIASTGPLGNTPLELFARGTAAYTIIKTDLSSGGATASDDDGVGAFNIGGGVQWNMNKEYWLRAEYIYNVAISDGDNIDYSDFDYDGVQISIGLRF